MTKKRDRSETEYLRGLVRSLKSQVRHLKRHNKELGAQAQRYEDHEEDMREEGEQPAVELAPAATECSCGKGDLIHTDLGVKTLITCSACTFRKVKKK